MTAAISDSLRYLSFLQFPKLALREILRHSKAASRSGGKPKMVGPAAGSTEWRQRTPATRPYFHCLKGVAGASARADWETGIRRNGTDHRVSQLAEALRLHAIAATSVVSLRPATKQIEHFMRSIDLLDWDDLKVFLAVARTGNLAQTAKLLRVDHSTVSRRVAQLETALGYGVFERSRTGFRINDLGERLLARAEVIESEIIGISADVQDEVSSAAGTVKLATMEGIGSLYLAPRMVHLKAFAPKLKMELITSPQVIHVNRREADLFLSFFKPSGQGLVSQKIGVFKLHLYAHPDYISSKGGAPRSEVELRDYEFITYIEDLIQVDSVRWLRDVIDDVTSIFNSNSMIAQMMAAAGGLGVVLLPKFAVHEGSPLVPIMPGTMSTTREIWLNVHQDLQFAPRIKTVVSFLKQQIDKDIRAGAL